MKTYDDIVSKLKSNHFLSAIVVEKGKTTEVHCCPNQPILIEEKLLIIKEVLEGFPVTVKKASQNSHIIVKLKTS